jgi:hypothetical protein
MWMALVLVRAAMPAFVVQVRMVMAVVVTRAVGRGSWCHQACAFMALSRVAVIFSVRVSMPMPVFLLRQLNMTSMLMSSMAVPIAGAMHRHTPTVILHENSAKD